MRTTSLDVLKQLYTDDGLRAFQRLNSLCPAWDVYADKGRFHVDANITMVNMKERTVQTAGGGLHATMDDAVIDAWHKVCGELYKEGSLFMVRRETGSQIMTFDRAEKKFEDGYKPALLAA